MDGLNLSMNFKDKKVTVMGLGLYRQGSGIAATRFLVERGARVTVTDLKTKNQLQSQIKRLGPLARKINFVLGRHRQIDFRKVDLVVKNPGVPNTSKYLKIAVKNKIPIETDISLFFKLVERKRIIGITGTRGKSTTTSLIYEIIKSTDPRAILGGNITKSPLAQMRQVSRGGPIILELSSWMLESLAPPRLSPHIAVVTNIYPDHLNTYQSMADYIKAKENIWQWQNLQDFVVLNRDHPQTRQMGRRVPGRRVWFSLKEFKEENGCFIRAGVIYNRDQGCLRKIMPLKEIKLLGVHNIYNVLAAISVGMIYGVDPGKIRHAVKNFSGLADRLEFLGASDGVKYYNDTTSTTSEATIAALAALSDNRRKNIILIAGGADKGLAFNHLIESVNQSCRALVLLKGTGTERLKRSLSRRKNMIRFFEAESMASAVNQARALARPGEIILLSPAFASFGLFVNEFDRGRQFKKIVKKIVNH